jgi:hypothetical protein
MKKFTKSLMTLALLGVAGVVNAQDFTEVSATGWCHEYRNGSADQTDAEALMDGDAYKVHVRSLAEAQESKPTTEKLDGWDTQFFIVFGEENALEAGDQIRVSFSVKADHDQTVGTQAHARPGNYIHWYAIDNVSATTEWTPFTKTVEAHAAHQNPDNGNMEFDWGATAVGTWSIAFNLTPDAAADQVENTFYFKDLKIEILKEKPASEITWTTIVDGEESCYYKKENRGEPGPAEVVNGVVTVTCPALVDNPWDTQFWIRLPQAVESGTKCHVTFKYKASAAVNPGAPQIHNEPSEYCGNTSLPALDCSNASDWTDYEGTFTVSSNNGSFQSLAFNLSVENQDVIYYFKDAKVEIPQEAVVTGISEISVEKASEGIFDLSGRRVSTFNKGIYVVDGKKVVK